MSQDPRGSVSVLGALVLVVLAWLVAALGGAAATVFHVVAHGSAVADARAAVLDDVFLVALCQLLGWGTATGVGVLAVFGNEAHYREALDVRAVPAAIAVLALTAGFALQFPLAEVANLVTTVAPSLGLDPEAQRRMRDAVHIDGWGEAITVPLAAVAIPALSEELLFRGLLLPGLERRHGPRVALVLSSVLFGVAHLAPLAAIYATIAGFPLGWVRQRTGSVLPCVAMHGAFNAAPVLLPPELIRIEGFNTVGADVYHLPLTLVLGSAAIVGLCLYTLSRLAPRE